MEILIYTLFFIYGAVIGSFLNVCAYRLPLKQSVVSGRSRCTSCGKNIKPYDLIPLFSWLLLRGRCRACGAKISVRYFLVELITGALYLAAAYFYALPAAVVMAAFYSILVVIFLIDKDYGIIPNGLNVTIAALAAVIFFMRDISAADRLVGAVVVSAPILITALITKGFGMGDVKLYAALGLFFGWKVGLFTLVASLILGGAGAAFLLARKKAGRKTQIAFGPYICAAAVIASVCGEQIVGWYARLFLF